MPPPPPYISHDPERAAADALLQQVNGMVAAYKGHRGKGAWASPRGVAPPAAAAGGGLASPAAALGFASPAGGSLDASGADEAWGLPGQAGSGGGAADAAREPPNSALLA